MKKQAQIILKKKISLEKNVLRVTFKILQTLSKNIVE